MRYLRIIDPEGVVVENGAGLKGVSIQTQDQTFYGMSMVGINLPHLTFTFIAQWMNIRDELSG